MVDSNIADNNSSEFRLLTQILANLGNKNKAIGNIVVGNGDDAAVISVNHNLNQVLSIDTFVQDRHFKLEWMTSSEIGIRCYTQAIADIYAMGATPQWVMLSLAGFKEWPLVDWQELIFAIDKQAQIDQVNLVGGDITVADQVVVTIAAGGIVDKPIRMDTAQPDNIIMVSGQVGASAAGLALLESSKQTLIDKEYTELINLYKKPELNLAAVIEATRFGATSLTDISDGLSSELNTLAYLSDNDLRINTEKIPLHPKLDLAAKKLAMDFHHWQLNGGEDHTFLATFPAQQQKLLKNWFAIGEVVEKKSSFALPEVTDQFGTVINRSGWDSLDS